MSNTYKPGDVPESAIRPIIVEKSGDGTVHVRAETYGGDVVSQGSGAEADADILSKVHARAAMRHAEANGTQVHTDVVKTART